MPAAVGIGARGPGVAVELPERFIGAGTKLYLNLAGTRRWLAGIAADAELFAAANLFVAPAFPALPMAGEVLAGTGVALAAQDAHWVAGPYSGAVPAAMLAELGCAYAEVGHSERRRHFGETDQVVARKACAVAAAGMTPALLVGEPVHSTVDGAVTAVGAQLAVVSEALPRTASLVVAYEPVWAVGADRPADPGYVAEVLTGISGRCVRAGSTRLVYGGSSRPGTFTALRAAGAPIDGIFVGRSALDLVLLAEVAAEVLPVSVARG